MKTKLKISFLLIFCALGFFASAQKIEISFDKDSMLIGDHLVLHILVTGQKEDRIFLPLYQDSIASFEIIEAYPPDTGENTISQNILLTQFKEGTYIFGGIPAILQDVYNNFDTISSNDVMLHVSTLEVDTSQAIKPFKSIKSLPFPWKEFLKKWGPIIAVIVLAIIILFWYLIKRKKLFVVPEKPKTMLDYYEEAIKNLEELDSKKLWQNDQIKEYYLGISEILRSYLEGRFGVNAMESTTDEIREELFLDNSLKNKVCEILEQADLAKFAKFKPLNDENLRMMKLAKDFVKHTKPKNLETEDDK
ncbi:MAG: hypothetical protein H6579_00405 [Chitinophagales bacterium]|nr:hypothetical protein [Chitinophagales bacterium]